MSPYCQDEQATIYCGDCREILPALSLASIPLVLTDIPYGEVNRESGGLRIFDKGNADAETFTLEAVVPELVRVASGSLYVWCGTEQVSELRSRFVNAGLTTRLCIWEKSDPAPVNGEHLWLSGLEACVFARKPRATFHEFCKSPIWRGPSADQNGHPTPKPEWLMSRIILASSNPTDTVLDICCGSGSTLRAAKDTGRRAIGIEIEERYCEIAAKRLSQGVLFGVGASVSPDTGACPRKEQP